MRKPLANRLWAALEKARNQAAERAGELASLRRDAWNAGIEAALRKLPGGSTCDPQEVADEIRTLMRTTPDHPETDFGMIRKPDEWQEANKV